MRCAVISFSLFVILSITGFAEEEPKASQPSAVRPEQHGVARGKDALQGAYECDLAVYLKGQTKGRPLYTRHFPVAKHPNVDAALKHRNAIVTEKGSERLDWRVMRFGEGEDAKIEVEVDPSKGTFDRQCQPLTSSPRFTIPEGVSNFAVKHTFHDKDYILKCSSPVAKKQGNEWQIDPAQRGAFLRVEEVRKGVIIRLLTVGKGGKKLVVNEDLFAKEHPGPEGASLAQRLSALLNPLMESLQRSFEDQQDLGTALELFEERARENISAALAAQADSTEYQLHRLRLEEIVSQIIRENRRPR